jgi:hypothetical protein
MKFLAWSIECWLGSTDDAICSDNPHLILSLVVQVCRKVVLDQTSDHMLQDNMGRIGRKSISVRSAASRGIRWMRTVGLAPEAIT